MTDEEFAELRAEFIAIVTAVSIIEGQRRAKADFYERSKRALDRIRKEREG